MSTPGTLAARRVTLTGRVQGVGFRPWVVRLATRLGIAGEVQNTSEGVAIVGEGREPALALFLESLARPEPPGARVDRLESEPIAPVARAGFAIVASERLASRPALPPPDLGPCERCLAELADPSDRRHGYAFVACVDCGPRVTAARDLPFDRERTTMAGFPLCPRCAAEYRDPGDRRCHAQMTGCPECGPRLAYEPATVATGRISPGRHLGGKGEPPGLGLAPRGSGSAPPACAGDPALAAAVSALERGEVLAVKGVGGYHLVGDATRPETVARIRTAKDRDARPLGLLVADLAAAARLVLLSPADADRLSAPDCPLLLLPKRADVPSGGPPLAPGIAPGLAELAVMLPPSPLHFQLAAALARPLVLTSGNPSGEPLATTAEEARAALATRVDGFLHHDREIALRLDDSVLRPIAGRYRPLRRARGLFPDSIPLASPGTLLAAGADLKSTWCLVDRGRAVVGGHVGDLGSLPTRDAWSASLRRWLDLSGARIERVVVDLHPDAGSTRLGEELASDLSVPIVRVQHHHAHLAAVMAEHREPGPVLGIALDGFGYGADGTAWGGELMVVDEAGAERVGHFRPVTLPGGDRAAREPWRMAVSWLLWAGLDPARGAPPGLPPETLALLVRAIGTGTAGPPTTSCGRLFDAVAALTGVRHTASYEGQAAMELEALAAPGAEPYPFRLPEGPPWVLDFRPMIEALVAPGEGGHPGPRASRFHATLVAALTRAAITICEARALTAVALAGGCFQNRLLSEGLAEALGAAGLRVLLPEAFPCNDGGVSLGQAAVAAAAWRREG